MTRPGPSEPCKVRDSVISAEDTGGGLASVMPPRATNAVARGGKGAQTLPREADDTGSRTIAQFNGDDTRSPTASAPPVARASAPSSQAERRVASGAGAIPVPVIDWRSIRSGKSAPVVVGEDLDVGGALEWAEDERRVQIGKVEP